MGYALTAHAQELSEQSAPPSNAGSISQQFQVSVQLVPTNTPKPKRPYSPYPWSCLASVQYWIKDFPRGVGKPNNLTPNQAYPTVGAAILTTESRDPRPEYATGHIGKVTDIITTPSRVWVVFDECNFHGGQCGSRTLDMTDPVIRGYYVPGIGGVDISQGGMIPL